MDFLILFSLFILCIIFIKILKIFEDNHKPILYHSKSPFIKSVLARCKSLHKPYKPPVFWGKNGHIQTAVYGKIGRWNSPFPSGKRYLKKLKTGETMSYDVFLSSSISSSNQYSILVCPGICNSSEKKYIRTFVDYALNCGFHVFVLNHIGVLPSVKLTSPKIFTYGETKYFAHMVNEAKSVFPKSMLIMVGFSMGANIVTRYLGEDMSHQQMVVCAVSLCQGYHGIRSTTFLNSGFGRFYNYMITSTFKKILQPHWKDLFHLNDHHVYKNLSTLFDEEKVKHATSLQEIEDGLLKHMVGYSSSYELKRDCGCENALYKVKIPFLLLNSEDDPLVVNDVHNIPINYCENYDEGLFVKTKHGGHLGFFKGGFLYPDDATVLEEYVMEFILAVLDLKCKKY